jgi:hypothetical protein
MYSFATSEKEGFKIRLDTYCEAFPSEALRAMLVENYTLSYFEQSQFSVFVLKSACC